MSFLVQPAWAEQVFSSEAENLIEECQRFWPGGLSHEVYTEIEGETSQESGWRRAPTDWDGVTTPYGEVLSVLDLGFFEGGLKALHLIEATEHYYLEQEICFDSFGQPQIAVKRETFVGYRICPQPDPVGDTRDSAEIWIEKITRTSSTGFRKSEMRLFAEQTEYPVENYCGHMQPLEHFWQADQFEQPARFLEEEGLSAIRAAPDL